MKRTLSLRREPLAELSADDLGGVVGGQYSGNGITCGILDCLDQPRTTTTTGTTTVTDRPTIDINRCPTLLC